FFQALDRAGCRPEETLFIGDTPNMDIIGAEAVGMRGVLIEETTDIAIDRGSADGVQTTIRELPELLDFI
ncbi:MAG: HAD hydrolase-like protein, partial [Chloroflexi bacterium]|nr:HAD hydrolase-like protein [Chloroflexota bacterium]